MTQHDGSRSDPAIRHLRHLAGFHVNTWAYCEARMRLRLATLSALNKVISPGG